MHTQVVEKIKKLRREKGIEPKIMADKLNISISAYNKLEAGKTMSWAKYINEILNELDLSAEEFFKDISNGINIVNRKGSFGGNIHVENLFAENKDKSKKIEELYEERLKDSDKRLDDKDKIIEELKEILKIKIDILAILEKNNKTK